MGCGFRVALRVYIQNPLWVSFLPRLDAQQQREETKEKRRGRKGGLSCSWWPRTRLWRRPELRRPAVGREGGGVGAMRWGRGGVGGARVGHGRRWAAGVRWRWRRWATAWVASVMGGVGVLETGALVCVCVCVRERERECELFRFGLKGKMGFILILS